MSLLQLPLFWNNTVNLKECMWLQLVSFNRKRAIRRMDGCNWRQINSISLKIRDDYKCLFQRKTVPWKIVDHCKWPPEIMTVPLKCIAASAPLKLQYALNIWQIHSLQTYMYSTLKRRENVRLYVVSGANSVK